MSSNAGISDELSGLKAVLKERLQLTIYFSVWFCAIIFYDKNTLGVQGMPEISYGFAVARAFFFANMVFIDKFLPLAVRHQSSFYWTVISKTTVNTLILLLLCYVFSGIEGLFRDQDFIDAMRSYSGGNLRDVLAETLLHWLIIMPYVVYLWLREVIGPDNLHSYLEQKQGS